MPEPVADDNRERIVRRGPTPDDRVHAHNFREIEGEPLGWHPYTAPGVCRILADVERRVEPNGTDTLEHRVLVADREVSEGIRSGLSVGLARGREPDDGKPVGVC
jgi:hypothetical protein